MLDEICPIQFIEGVNENLELAPNRFLQVRGYDRVAVQFIPTITFLLVKIEICLVWGNIGSRETYDVKLRLGYKDNLTDTFLSDGELSFEPIRSGYGWCKLDLNQPVVVISKKQYWLDIASRDAMFHLGRAENGAEVAIRAMMNGVWSDYVSESKGPMLKFYGRVLPVLS